MKFILLSFAAAFFAVTMVSHLKFRKKLKEANFKHGFSLYSLHIEDILLSTNIQYY